MVEVANANTASIVHILVVQYVFFRRFGDYIAELNAAFVSPHLFE
jgi:hypothetical protein